MKNKYLFLIFLLFFNPSLIFLVKNINYYELGHFKFIFLFTFAFLILSIFLIFLLKKILIIIDIKKFLLFLSISWFLQFYFIEIINTIPIESYYNKYVVLLLILTTGAILSYFKNEKLLKFLINFNLIILFLVIIINLSFDRNIDSKEQVTENYYYNLENYDKNLIKKNNIYFFLMDELSSREFLLTEELDIQSYINFFKDSGFQYLDKSFSSYNGSQYTIGSIFNMEYFKENIPIKEIKFYPYNLYSKFEKPNLLKTLDFLNYNFWFLDNQYMKCKENTYINCVGENNIALKILKDEGIQVFFQNSALRSMVNKILYLTNNKNYNATEIDRMKIFLDKNEKIIKKKNNFFFVHNIGPHHPHRYKNCKILDINERYKINKKYYLDSTICALNNISQIIKKIEAIDKDSTIIVQGDHGYAIYSDDNKIESFQIFNMVKFTSKCSKKLNPSIGNVETINEVFHCFRKEKSLPNNISNFIIKNKDSKGTEFKKIKFR